MRVAIADDQPIICRGFADLLAAQSDIDVVGTACDGVELLDLVARQRPDVALVDIRMPQMDGIEATTRIAATSSTRSSS